MVKMRSYWQPLRSVKSILFYYFVLATIAALLLLIRYDLFPALLTLLALFWLTTKRPLLSGISIGLGIAAKLYPMVLLPIFIIYYWVGRERRALAYLVLGCMGVMVCLLISLLWLDPGFSFLRYHQLRGFQIESLPAGIFCFTHALGIMQIEVVFNYGAHHIASPLADIIVKWQPVVSILAFVSVVVICLRRFRQEYSAKGVISRENLVICILITLLTFIATNKVFSPQYIVWLLPFAPLLRTKHLYLLIAIFIITFFIYPVLYDNLLKLKLLPIVLLNLRNGLVITLIYRLCSTLQYENSVSEDV